MNSHPESAGARKHVPFDRATEDVGNIVEFGHMNFGVPDQQLAIAFYVAALGLTRDPFLRTGLDNAWINVGTSQFHLPVGTAQVLRGTTGLVMPDLDALLQRLAAARASLAGTRFDYERRDDGVDIRCPWGNRLRVHAPDAARFGPLMLGMPYVEIDVVPGTSAAIARFYGEVLGALACTVQDAQGSCARIQAGPNSALVFRETGRELPAYDGHHLQISVADFSGVHRRLVDRGLVSEESNASQYRFERIVDPDSGELLTTLEHEVRSMRHPLYARPLLNRDPAMVGNRYAAGHESMPWCMPPR